MRLTLEQSAALITNVLTGIVGVAGAENVLSILRVYVDKPEHLHKMDALTDPALRERIANAVESAVGEEVRSIGRRSKAGPGRRSKAGGSS